MSKKILLVFGTRPEAIKMAPLVKILKEASAHFETEIAVSGQHREMLDQVLDLFEIKPDFDLDIMQTGQDLSDVTTRVLQGMKGILRSSKPDLVVVQGDTTTAFAGALAAFYEGIPVAHVEAGLRTGNLANPFPEEANRQLISRLARLHFAPTEIAKKNLLDEGISEDRIFVTGNTVIDALHSLSEKLLVQTTAHGVDISLKDAGLPDNRLNIWNAKKRKLVLITVHRRENRGAAYRNIFQALSALSEKHLDTDFVFPVHPNPEVVDSVKKYLTERPNLFLLPPLEYLPFMSLMMAATLILTDSGGIQEEAAALQKPVLVMRKTTERPEGIEAGFARLVGTQTDSIISITKNLLENAAERAKMVSGKNPYGDGKAAMRILAEMLKQENHLT